MKKSYYLIVLTLILGLVLTGCFLSNVGQVPTSEQSDVAYLTKGTLMNPDVFTLYAGQHIDVGTVSVWDDSINLYVEYTTTGDWEMIETHLYVGKTNPEELTSAPGQFPYSEEHDPADTTYTYTIPLATICSYSLSEKGKKWVTGGDPCIEPGGEIFIAAQAEVFRSSEGNVLENPNAEVGNMTGWSCIGPVGASVKYVEFTGTVGPRSGEYFFSMKDFSAVEAKMFQELTVVGYDGASFKASGWIQTELYLYEEGDSIIDDDYGQLVVTFYDNSNDELESFATDPIGNPVSGTGSDGYIQFSLEGIIPNGAEKAVYELNGFRVEGTIINVFYDDLSFEYWQEETAWAEGDNFGKNWATYFTYNIALVVGDSYGGGKVAYILQFGETIKDENGDVLYSYDESVQHGLIAAIRDQTTEIQKNGSPLGVQWWNGSSVETGATGTAIGTGQANTKTIVTVQGEGSYAAQRCNDLTEGGYDDWYLPSIDELGQLYINRDAIGGFADIAYWSSSEHSSGSAREQYFRTGNQSIELKGFSLLVRAVRAF